MSLPNTPEPRLKPCPLCRKPAQARFAPFCSAGCRDRDLLAWLGEDYRVSAGLAEDLDAEGLDRDEAASL